MSDPRNEADLPVVRGGSSLQGLLSPHAIDDPIALSDLLNPEERTLLDAARELGCELTLIDASGQAVVGSKNDGLHGELAKLLGTTPGSVSVRVTGRDYLCLSLLHDGEALGVIAAGPLLEASEGRARVLRIAHYLIRLAETLVTGALRRTLTTRVHLAHVEEAYCELQQKTHRLEQAIQRMKDSDRIKANFLATVSHELRTPLTSVLGYSEMLLEGLAGPLNDEQREYLQTVMVKGEQLLGLITTLLDVSRIESVGVELQRTAVDVHELVRDVLQTLAPQGRRKRLNLHAELPEQLWRLDGDRDKLRQVLLNLVGNAIKFTPAYGEIKVVGQNLPPDHGPGPLGDTGSAIARVQLSVIDTGIGIPSHLHDKVFDAFYQVDNSATREYEGSGLGLAIVRKFVEAHGGQVWVENGDGRGAVFRVTLPAAVLS
jgi:signal transduction histidine kinase